MDKLSEFKEVKHIECTTGFAKKAEDIEANYVTTSHVPASFYSALLAFAEEQQKEVVHWKYRWEAALERTDEGFLDRFESAKRLVAAEAKVEEQQKEIGRLEQKLNTAEADCWSCKEGADRAVEIGLELAKRAEAAEAKLSAMQQRCEVLESLNTANQLLLNQKESSRVSKPYRVALQKLSAMEEVLEAVVAAMDACQLQMLQSNNDSEYAEEANEMTIMAREKVDLILGRRDA